jgi:hypothetical protein
MADLRNLIAANLTPDMSILLRKGDSFYARPTNAPQGIAAPAFGHYTIASYTDPDSPSTEKPRLLGFYRPGAQAWTALPDGTLPLNAPAQIYWVRGRAPGAISNHAYRDTPYIKHTDPTSVHDLPYSFAQSSSTLTIHPGPADAPHDRSDLELAVAIGAGILVGEVDDVRLDGLIVEGWGMDTVSSVNGCILFNGIGTNSMLVTNCEWGWGPYHAAAHIASTGSGGIMTLSGCEFGYHQQRDAALGGSGDGFVSFALRGNNECIMDRCTGFGGGLQRLGVPGADQLMQGSTCYAHTDGATPIGLNLRRGCHFLNSHPSRARYSSYPSSGDAVVDPVSQIHGFLPLIADNVACYRAFVIDEAAELDAPPNASGWHNVEINWRLTLSAIQQLPNTTFWGGGSATPAGLSINRDLKIILPPDFSAYYFFSNSSQGGNQAWFHTRCRVTGGGPLTQQNFLQVEAADYVLFQAKIYNSIYSNEVHDTSGSWTYQQWDPDESVGGTSHCAFLGFDPSLWDQSVGAIGLASEPAYTLDDAGRALIDPALIAAGNPNPMSRDFVEYDITHRLRPLRPTLGPLEATPVQCLADINADGVIDFFDYLDFVDAYASQHTWVDFNHDGVLDFFDYLDFVDMFSRGCS